MKKVTTVHSYIIEVRHSGDDYIFHSAIRHLNDEARTTVNVDVDKDSSLRIALDLDGNKICPEKFSGKPVCNILNDDFWSASGILDLKKGAEVIELSIELKETGAAQYKSVNLDTKWSIWSLDDDFLDDDTLAQVQAALDGSGEPISIQSNPSKEVRFGTVWVSEKSISYEFYCEWDDAYSLVSDSITNLGQRILFSNQIDDWIKCLYPQCNETKATAFVEGEFIANSWGEVTLLLNKAEDCLLEIENINSQALEQFINESKSLFA